MAEWTRVRIGDMCKTNTSSYSQKEGWAFVNYLDTGNITKNVIDEIQYIDLVNEKLPSRAKRKVKYDSVLFSTVRPNQLHYGIVKTQPENFLVSTGFAVLDADPHKLNPDYLYYLLSSNDIVEGLHAIAEQSVSAYPSIKPSDIENLEVVIPDIETQRKISAVLLSIDDKIRLNMMLNKNLEQQAASYYRYLFIENADPSWPEGTISDLGTVVGGSTPSKSKPEYYTDHGIAWITPKDLSVDKSKFISHGADDITELGLRNSSASIMPPGTVLFSSRAPIGYIAIADGEVTTNQGFKSVVPKEEIGTAFIYYFLKNALPTIENMASGSTFKEISGSAMRTVPAIIPDGESIRVFTEFCAPLFQQQRTLEAENRYLSLLRDSLLPKLMSGEIDVSDLSI